MINNIKNDEKKGRRPDATNSEYGIALWINPHPIFKEYYTINIPALGLKNIAIFPPKPKPLDNPQDNQPTTEEEKVI